MSTTTAITLVCDRDVHDGRDVPAESTRTLGHGSDAYEIDLCGPCSAALDSDLAEVLEHARKVKGKHDGRNARMRQEDAAIRAWWATVHPDVVGRPYRDKGRLPADVIAKYRARNRSKSTGYADMPADSRDF